MPFVDLREQAILNYLFRDVALANLPATTWYIGLSTTTPTEAGGNFTEPSGGAYARVAVVRSPTGSAEWAAASGTAPALTSNSGVETFPQATASWSTVTHFGIFDALTAGNLWFWGALTTSKEVGSGDTASFAAGVLQIKAGKQGDTLT
jgi:hypothetical protein